MLPNSPNEKSNLKSFLEIDKIPVTSNDEERMCLELCFGTPKACHLLTIHSQSFLMWVMDARARLNNKKKSLPQILRWIYRSDMTEGRGNNTDDLDQD